MIVQLASAFLGSLGFALILKIKGRQILYTPASGTGHLVYLFDGLCRAAERFYCQSDCGGLCGDLCRADGQGQQSAGDHFSDCCCCTADTWRQAVLYHVRPGQRRRRHVRRKRHGCYHHRSGDFTGLRLCSGGEQIRQQVFIWEKAKTPCCQSKREYELIMKANRPLFTPICLLNFESLWYNERKDFTASLQGSVH